MAAGSRRLSAGEARVGRRPLLVASAALLAGLAKTPIPLAHAQGNGQLRLVHAWAGVGGVDVSVDGARVWSGLEFGRDTGYLVVTAGDHLLAVESASASPAASVQLPVGLGAGQTLTAIVVGPPADAIVLEDEGLAPVGGPALVRLAHATRGAAPVVLAREAGATLVGPISGGQSSAYVEAEVGAMTLMLRAADTGVELTRIPGAVLVPDRAYTFVAAETAGEQPPWRLIPLADALGAGLTG
jgi:hypothetical protein